MARFLWLSFLWLSYRSSRSLCTVLYTINSNDVGLASTILSWFSYLMYSFPIFYYLNSSGPTHADMSSYLLDPAVILSEEEPENLSPKTNTCKVALIKSELNEQYSVIFQIGHLCVCVLWPFLGRAFFWLVSLLLSSLVWFISVQISNKESAPQQRGLLIFGVVLSVLLQELFRFGYYKLLK